MCERKKKPCSERTGKQFVQFYLQKLLLYHLSWFHAWMRLIYAGPGLKQTKTTCKTQQPSIPTSIQYIQTNLTNVFLEHFVTRSWKWVCRDGMAETTTTGTFFTVRYLQSAYFVFSVQTLLKQYKNTFSYLVMFEGGLLCIAAMVHHEMINTLCVFFSKKIYFWLSWNKFYQQ